MKHNLSLLKSLVLVIILLSSLTITTNQAIACWLTVQVGPPQYIPADGNTSAVITATLRRRDGGPNNGQTVTFSIVEGAGRLEDPPSKVTDNSGKATIRYYQPKTNPPTPTIARIKAEVTITEPSGRIRTFTAEGKVYVVKVELANTTKEYVVVGNNLNVSAVLTPSSATGGNWSWTTLSPTCGSGSFSTANPTTFTSSGEGCIYPRAGYTISSTLIQSPGTQLKRILVYVDPGTNSAITPTSNPTTTSDPGGGQCDPDDPTLEWKAYFDESDKKWHARVTGLECTGTIRVSTWPASGTPNPVPDGNVTQSNYQAIIADLADYSSTQCAGDGTGGGWHSTEATRAHENYHWNTDWMSTSIGTYWPSCETDLENLSIPEGSYCKASEAKAALASSVNSRLSTFIGQCNTKWNSLPETGAYAAGQAVLNGIIADIQQFAQEQGW